MRYLIIHRRTRAYDLIEEEGELSIERMRHGIRTRMSVEEFERSDDAETLRSQLQSAIAAARAHSGQPQQRA